MPPTAGQELDADAAVMFEDLSARLAGLQALVDSLVASKADRRELELVQAMLADTATQSDTDMLHHKLDAQQQQLARLQSATQRLAGSRPQERLAACQHHLRLQQHELQLRPQQ